MPSAIFAGIGVNADIAADIPGTYDPAVQIVGPSGTDGIPDVLSLLAHQGGWDELLFVAAPLVVFAGLLVVAKRRASALTDDDRDDPHGPDNPLDR